MTHTTAIERPLLARDLKRVFGYDSFRPLQREIMDASLDGRDALAILPTGAGKSLCYQLPALSRTGLTVVASPLIALMKDQVDQMSAAGVPTAFLNSTLDAAQLRKRYEKLEAGAYRILYVAPERLVQRDFLVQLRSWSVEAFAVDEAHCISEWGHDFRPEYRQIATARDAFPLAPIMALTATATARVREDIVAQLRLRDPAVFVASFDRPNLTYRVEPKQSGRDGISAQVIALAARRPRDSGIVYCQSRKATETIAAALTKAGQPALAYHAGLEANERARTQDAFLRDEVRIICATVAFGMGVNKPNVRFVLHADLPKNIESYYQETGRAGRDGLPSECVLLYSRGDVAKHLHFLAEITDSGAQSTARGQLEGMVEFAESARCRREELLGYFGERYTAAEEGSCSACDNCVSPRALLEVTIDAQKLMSCVLRVHQKSGFHVGLGHLAEVLCGANTEKIRRWNHETLSTYGAGASRSRLAWIALGRQLLQSGLLELGRDGFAVITLTQLGADTLRSREPIFVRQAVAPINDDEAIDANIDANGSAAPRKRGKRKSGATRADVECDRGLFETLRALRKQIADARGVPPYVVFGDVSLTAMASTLPRSRVELLAIPGVGEKRLADFGDQFIEAIAQWSAPTTDE